MSLGSFLQTVSNVGLGMDAAQERQRVARQRQLEIEALNRQEQFRREQLQAPELQALEGLQLGAPMQVAEPEFTFTPPETGAGLAPPPPPAAAGKPPVAAPAYVAKTKQGKIIPQYRIKAPVKLDTYGLEGFEVADPDASDFTKDTISQRNQSKLDMRLTRISNTVTRDISLVPQYFQGQAAKRAEQKATKAQSWYANRGQAGAQDYFRKNPDMLRIAEADPIAFYDALFKYKPGSDKAAAPVTPTPAATSTAATTGVQSAAPAGQTAATTAKARRFDTQGAQYAAVIQQAATRYGVDATILRRLIASESSFNPNIVNETSGALGLAQIMPSHIQRGLVSEAQARDPIVAINFAAAHLAQNLRNEGGDYRKALLRYKGAVSSKGVASMNPVVRDIVSGLTWNPQQVLGAVGPQLADSRDPATNASLALRQQAGGAQMAAAGQTGVTGVTAQPTTRLSSSDFYLGDTRMISRDMQIALRNRQELARLAGMYQRAGMGDEYTQTRLKLMEMDDNLTFLQGMQGIQDLALANDPRRLEAVWSQYAGIPIRLQPRTDGTYNVVVNGRVTQRGVTAAQITDAARSGFDQQYRADRAKIESDVSLEQFKSQLKREEKTSEMTLQATKDIYLELIKGNNAKALEIAKAQNGTLVNVNGVPYLNKGGELYLISPGGEQVPGAEEGILTGPSAQRVVGVGVG